MVRPWTRLIFPWNTFPTINACQNMICLSSSYFHVRWSVRLHCSEHFGVVRILSENRERSKKVPQAFIESHFATGNPLWNQKPLEKNGCFGLEDGFLRKPTWKINNPFFNFKGWPPPSFQLRPTNRYLSKIPSSKMSPFSPRWGSNKNGSPKSPESRRRNIRKISRGKIRAVVCWPAGWFNRVHLVAFLWDRKVWGKKAADRVRVFSMLK